MDRSNDRLVDAVIACEFRADIGHPWVARLNWNAERGVQFSLSSRIVMSLASLDGRST